MSQSSDFKSLFKAAKSSRGGAQKLSKEQIKALKAQKAAALASQAAGPSTLSAGPASSSEEDTRSMPPPPPRQPSAKPNASFHTDSQATQAQNGQGSHAAVQPEPSVNQQAGSSARVASEPGITALSEEVRSSHPDVVPTGLLQEGGVSGAASSGAGTQRSPAVPVVATAKSKQAPTMSLEGSTGALAGSNSGVNETTEMNGRALSGAQPSGVSGVPEGFFQMALHAEGEAGTEAADVTSTRMGGNPGGGLHLEHHDGQAGPLPKGFFQDQAADAKARGEKPKTKDELDKELADFLKQVDADSAEAAARKAEDDADEAAERQEREEFEHIVRLQRLEDLKHGTGTVDRMTDKIFISATEVVQNPEVDVPAIQLPKKRKVADTVADLERNSGSDSEDSEDDNDLLDWRAKKSAF